MILFVSVSLVSTNTIDFDSYKVLTTNLMLNNSRRNLLLIVALLGFHSIFRCFSFKRFPIELHVCILLYHILCKDNCCSCNDNVHFFFFSSPNSLSCQTSEWLRVVKCITMATMRPYYALKCMQSAALLYMP